MKEEIDEAIKSGKQYAKDLRFNKINIATAIPPIIYLANKSEDGYEGDILGEFYKSFPQMATEVDEYTNEPIEPLFVSSEHGDGLPDLFGKIKSYIPPSKE